MTVINHNFYKTLMLDFVEQAVFQERTQLLNELVAAGNDPVIWTRRFRMLSQLSHWHADIVKKIHAFEADTVEEYRQFKTVMTELKIVVSRNA